MNVEDLVKICKGLNIDPDQALCLYYLSKDKEYPLFLPSAQYKNLYHRGLVKKHEPTKKYLEEVDRILNKPKRDIIIHPKLVDIIFNLSTLLNPESLFTEKQKERTKDFFKDDRLPSFYLLWLNLFPAGFKDKDEGWESLFGVSYDGVPLRKIIDSNMRNFKSIAYTKDLGIYLLTTYLFIRSYIRDGKCFIPKITNFIIDQTDLYENTKQIVETKNESELLELFDLNSSNSIQNEFNYGVAPGMIQG